MSRSSDWFGCCAQMDTCCQNPQSKGNTVLVERDSGRDNERTAGRSPRTAPSQLAGVGIIFRLQPAAGSGNSSSLVVDEVVKGSPTDRQGEIKPDFQLLAVDDTDVRGMTPRQIAPLILGPPGSDVALCFKNPNDGPDPPVWSSTVSRNRP